MANRNSMQRIYENFLESLNESVDERDLVRSMAILLPAFEVERFAYLSFASYLHDRPRLISNYPDDWMSFYLGKKYSAIDPVIKAAHYSDQPFYWGKDFSFGEHSTAQLRLFDEAAEFGICSGLTIPIQDRRGNAAALTFAAKDNCPALLRVADRYLKAIQLIATCFHIHARRRSSDKQSVGGVVLTKREYECLQWAAKGKSAWEIGQILGITRRTAAFHLDNARQKLGVRTIAQAVVRLAYSHSPIR